MALAASTLAEIQTGGSDTNGGGFDPQNANMSTNLACDTNTGNTSAPIVSSQSYNFAARDVGHWVFVQSGTNWIPGWYQIASVANNKATLNAAAGSGVLYNGWGHLVPSTATGCATTGTPSGGKWSIDYSQNTTLALTDMAIDGTTNTKFTSSGTTVGVNFIGNIINVTSGTGFTVQRVQILSVSGTTATCDKSLGTLSSTGGHGNLGGPIASIGLAGSLTGLGIYLIYIKSGTYTSTSASSNVSTGVYLPASGLSGQSIALIGYGSVRGDNGTPPVITASGISSFTLITMTNPAAWVENITVDGANLTSSRGINASSASVLFRCTAKNCTNGGIFGNNAQAMRILCEVTSCSTAAAFTSGTNLFCVSKGNTSTGFSIGNQASCTGCVSINNSGSSSDGFAMTSGGTLHNCVSYGNGRHGILITGSNGNTVVNTVVVGNGISGTGWGITQTGSVPTLANALIVACAGYNNASGNLDTANVPTYVSFTNLSADPFVSASGNDFRLNTSASGGALLRQAGIPGISGSYALPDVSTPVYKDIGIQTGRLKGNNLSGGLT